MCVWGGGDGRCYKFSQETCIIIQRKESIIFHMKKTTEEVHCACLETTPSWKLTAAGRSNLTKRIDVNVNIVAWCLHLTKYSHHPALPKLSSTSVKQSNHSLMIVNILVSSLACHSHWRFLMGLSHLTLGFFYKISHFWGLSTGTKHHTVVELLIIR